MQNCFGKEKHVYATRSSEKNECGKLKISKVGFSLRIKKNLSYHCYVSHIGHVSLGLTIEYFSHAYRTQEMKQFLKCEFLFEHIRAVSGLNVVN